MKLKIIQTIIKLLSVSLIIVLSTQPALANWYVVTKMVTEYGAWARISAPSTRPYMEWVTDSHQYNYVTINSNNWIQTGWSFGPDYAVPYSYVEICLDNCTAAPRYYREYTPQILGTKRDYLIEYVPTSTNIWCAYIDGIQKDCRVITTAPQAMSAASEVIASSKNEVSTIFENVRFKNSANIWQLFDSSWPVSSDCPYYGPGNSANFYATRGSCIYAPVIENP